VEPPILTVMCLAGNREAKRAL